MVLNKKEINVVGMHCPSCAIAVELSMKDLDGVEEAKSNLETNTVEVEYDSELVSDVDLVGAVREAGFEVK